MPNCPPGYETIHGSQLKSGREYRFRNQRWEADVLAHRRDEDGPGWWVQVVKGFVKRDTVGYRPGDSFFVPDSERGVLFEGKG